MGVNLGNMVKKKYKKRGEFNLDYYGNNLGEYGWKKYVGKMGGLMLKMGGFSAYL